MNKIQNLKVLTKNFKKRLIDVLSILSSLKLLSKQFKMDFKIRLIQLKYSN
jgi:hypothetical protein